MRLSGTDPRPVELAVFVVSGACAGLAGIVYTARLASADPNAAWASSRRRSRPRSWAGRR